MNQFVASQAFEAAEAAAKHIRTLEAEAMSALHDNNDPDTHRQKMIEKCRTLQDLPSTVVALLSEDGNDMEDAFLEGLENFATRAGQALGLESIFYMSALLYPDDYQDGQPNNLEEFLARFKN